MTVMISCLPLVTSMFRWTSVIWIVLLLAGEPWHTYPCNKDAQYCSRGICTYGPRPLLLGVRDLEPLPQECIFFSFNPVPDIGAYEYWPPYEAAQCGDVTLDRQVDIDDALWCLFCWSGPDSPLITYLVQRVTREEVPVNCWMCDFDWDYDVDLQDIARVLP